MKILYPNKRDLMIPGRVPGEQWIRYPRIYAKVQAIIIAHYKASIPDGTVIFDGLAQELDSGVYRIYVHVHRSGRKTMACYRCLIAGGAVIEEILKSPYVALDYAEKWVAWLAKKEHERAEADRKMRDSPEWKAMVASEKKINDKYDACEPRRGMTK